MINSGFLLAMSWDDKLASAYVNASIIEEYPLPLERKVKSWDTDAGHLIGEIVASQADGNQIETSKFTLYYGCKPDGRRQGSVNRAYQSEWQPFRTP